MNVADDGIVAAKKIKCQFYSGNCMALPTGLFVFGKISAQEQHVVHYSIAHKRSQLRKKSMPADKKAHSGSMLAGGISAKSSRHSVCTSICFHFRRIMISFLTIDAIS